MSQDDKFYKPDGYDKALGVRDSQAERETFDRGFQEWLNRDQNELEKTKSPNDLIQEQNEKTSENNQLYNENDEQKDHEPEINSDENSGSNSATKVCEVCDPEDGKCLCEVTVKNMDNSTKYYLKSNSKIKNDSNKRLPKTLLYISPLKISYDVIGECVNGPTEATDKCVAAYFYDYTKLVNTHAINSSESLKSHEYTKSIDTRIKENKKLFTPLSHSINQAYNDDYRVYVSLNNDKEMTYWMKKPDGIVSGELFDFIRGFDLLVFGKITYFPSNVYRLGVMTCSGLGSTNDRINTEHYTDIFVLPTYEVSFTGSLSLDGRKTPDSAKFEVEYKETVGDKETRTFKYSYKKLREKPEGENDGNADNNKFWGVIFKLVDAMERMKMFREKIEDDVDVDNLGLGHRIFPPLYRVAMKWPKLEIGAKAALINRGEGLYINREEPVPKEDPNKDNPKPKLADGIVNTPTNDEDAATRQTYESEYPKEPTAEQAFLKFNPLIGGYISFNIVGIMTRIPKVGTAIGMVNALLDFDMFHKLKGVELEFDNKKDRKDRLNDHGKKNINAQGFFFLTADISFNPALNFYNNFPDEMGAGLDIRGSLGLGIAAGASARAKIFIFEIKGDMQGSYGIRTHFSVNLQKGEAVFWHDGMKGEAEENVVVGGDININDREGKGQAASEYQSRDVSGKISGEGVSAQYSLVSANQSEYWIEPTTYDKPSWVYVFGTDIKNQIEDIKGQIYMSLKSSIEQTYQHGYDAYISYGEKTGVITERNKRILEKEFNTQISAILTETNAQEVYRAAGAAAEAAKRYNSEQRETRLADVRKKNGSSKERGIVYEVSSTNDRHLSQLASSAKSSENSARKSGRS